MPIPNRLSWSRLSLTAKALTLLALPLSVALTCGLALLNLQQQAEIEMQGVIRAQNISIQLHGLLADVMQLYTRSVDAGESQYMPGGYRGYQAPEFKALLESLGEKYRTLDQLTLDKPALNFTVKRAHQLFVEAKALIDQVNSDIAAGKLDQVLAAKRQKDERFVDIGHDAISQDMVLLAQSEQDFAVDLRKKQAETRDRTFKIIFIMIVANIIFSILLARFLVQTIIARIDVMADNALRLANNEELRAPLSGHDEIAQLDKVFHSMADTIQVDSQTKEVLYGIVTHDLRAPLLAIQDCLGLLSRQGPNAFSTRSLKLINVAERNSARTMSLVSDLLDSQKLEKGTFEITPDEVLLQEVFETVKHDIGGWLEERGIKIIFMPTDLIVLANQDLLGRVLFNLISNAIKYSPENGTITVEATEERQMAQISVADQGPGIAKEMLKAVFERFRQVPDDVRSRKGSGLGLSICSDFVQLHGGKIWVESQLGNGSTFYFTIPLAHGGR